MAGLVVLDAPWSATIVPLDASTARGRPETPGDTIVHSIRRHAAHRPDTVVLVFTRGTEADDTLTYGELDRRAKSLGSRLQAAVPAGAMVLTPMRSDAASVVALFACLYAGVPCAPVAYPARNSTTRQLEAIVAASKCRAIVASDGDLEPFFPGLPIFSEDGTGDPSWAPCEPASEDLAFVQFTSGSTAEPKGVMITHANVRANLEMMRIALSVGPETRYASWLPLFHDMGLAMALMPLYYGVPGALMPPLTFLRRPERWWQMVSHYAATITGAPNFAFEMSAKRIARDVIASIDLSRLKLAFCGGEPVRRSTMRLLARQFAPTGFRASALYPCYGMAETVCFTAGGYLFRDDQIESTKFEVPSETVSCGAPPPGATMRIVDPLTLRLCAERQAGEVWLSGPHIGGGYLGLPEATRVTFQARLEDSPDEHFLRTGDIGYLDNGALTIVGRLKDIIVYRGNNIHAVDVEAVVAACHPGFGPDGAAFAWDEDETEHVVLVHEAARGFDGALDEAMLYAALDAVAEHHAVRLLDLVLVRAGSIPRTSSGKVRRDACRALYANGDLRIVGRLRDKSAVTSTERLVEGKL